MGARQYLPGLGRFIQVDPVEGGSSNDYDYCDADPINCTDLAGTWPNLKKALHAIATVASVVSMVPGPIGQAASAVACVGYVASGDYHAAAAAAIGILAGGAVVATAVKAAKVIKSARAISEVAKAGKIYSSNHSVGTAGRLTSAVAGRMFVGRGAKRTSEGLVSKDGLRNYRGSQKKIKLGITQSNFETRASASRDWKYPNRVRNGHLRIKGWG